MLLIPVKNLGLIVTDLTRIETTEGLRSAVKHRFDRLVEKARREWESRFGQQDSGDPRVSVHVVPADSAKKRKPTRGSGPVTSSRKRGRRSPFSMRRFAH